nr:DUF4870 domain-containing protein [Chloroflexota bacterium]
MDNSSSPVPQVPPPAAPLSQSDERTWAMLAHLCVLLNVVTGFLGVLGSLLIYLICKDRSRYVAYQSLQAVVFQLVWWVGGGVVVGITWAITGILSAILIGILCIPIALIITLIPLAALGYGAFAGIECSQGKDFRYWLVGDWVRGTLTG